MQKKKWKHICPMMGCVLTVLFGSLSVQAETGATGYPKIVPIQWDDDELYLTAENAAKWQQLDESEKLYIYFEPEGFYDLDGHLVYLDESKLTKMTFIDSYFADENGYLQPYTPQTKPAVDAHINALLAQKKAEASALYGVNFNFRKWADDCDNCKYVMDIMQTFQEYPEGSISVISKATKAKTGKNLTFRKMYAEGDDLNLNGFAQGSYSYESNTVSSNGGAETIAHEMGHGMESVLNSASGGALKATFSQLNGGIAYNKCYFYAGDEKLYLDTDSFARPYSATSFAEDFADTFSIALCYDNAELEKDLQKGIWSMALYQKIMYVKQIFNQYAGAEILK